MSLSLDQIIGLTQLGFIVIGGIYALYLLRQSNRDKRNQLVLDVLDRFYEDDEIRMILYTVDHGLDTEEIRFNGRLGEASRQDH